MSNEEMSATEVLLGIAERIRDVSFARLDLVESIMAKKKIMSKIRLEAELMVATAVGVDGKKKYSNDLERKAATEAMCKANPEYIEAENFLEGKDIAQSRLEIMIEYDMNILEISKLAAEHKID